MLIPFARLNEDAHCGLKTEDNPFPIMVARYDGSFFGSYPFVTSSPEDRMDVTPGAFWFTPTSDKVGLIPVNAPTVNSLRRKQDEVVRYPSIAYIDSHAPSQGAPILPKHNWFGTSKAHGCAPRFPNPRRTKKTSLKPKKAYNNELFFGSQPVSLLTVEELEALILKELKVKVLPKYYANSPSDSRKKTPKLFRQRKDKVACDIAKSVTSVLEDLDPAHLCGLAMTQTKHAKGTNKSLSHKSRLIASQLSAQLHKFANLCEALSTPANVPSKPSSTFKGTHNPRNNDPHKFAQKHAHCFVASGSKTKTKTSTKKPTVHTIPEEYANEDTDEPDLMFFDQDESPTSTDPPSFARPRTDRNLVEPLTTEDDANDLTSPDLSVVKRLEAYLKENEDKTAPLFEELEALGIPIRDILSQQEAKEPSQDRHFDSSCSSQYETPKASSSSANTPFTMYGFKKTNPRSSDTTVRFMKSHDDDEDDDYSSSSSEPDSSSSSSTSSDDDDLDVLPPKPDGSVSPSAAEYWMSLYSSMKKLKKAKRRIRKKKKKTKGSPDVLFRYLMKAAVDYDLPILNYDADPHRRRGKYNHFLDKLKLVTSSVRQTRSILSDPNLPSPPKSRSANQALFRVICAKVEPHIRNQLIEMSDDQSPEDGFEALMLMRSLFADDKDHDFVRNTLNIFTAIQLKDGESVFNFNRRFSKLYRNVLGCHITIPNDDRLRIYLHALQHHTDSRVLYEVKAMIKDLNNGKPLGISDAQRLILREEEQANKINAPSNYKERRSRRSSNHSQANAAYTNNTPKKRFSKPFQGECFGCKRQGHTLRECRSTSDSDKQRIWDMMKKSKGSPNLKLPSDKDPSSALMSSAAKKPTKESSPNKGNASNRQHNSQRNDGKTTSDPSKKATRTRSYAAVALSAPNHKVAFACMATSKHESPEEGDLPDPFGYQPLPIDEDQVIQNDNPRTALYDDDEVILDSGASECMVPSLAYLDLIRSTDHIITIADGTQHESKHQGLLRIAVTCAKSGLQHTIPMLDTLLLPGLKKVLCDEFTIFLRNPKSINDMNTPLPFPQVANVAQANGADSDEEFSATSSSEDEEDSLADMPALLTRDGSLYDSDSDSDDEAYLPPLRPRPPRQLLKTRREDLPPPLVSKDGKGDTPDSDEEEVPPMQLRKDFRHFAQIACAVDPSQTTKCEPLDPQETSMNYDELKAYLCDLPDLNEDQTPWVSDDENVTFEHDKPSIRTHTKTFGAYPLMQLGKTRPKKPTKPNDDEGWREGSDRLVSGHKMAEYKGALGTYMKALLKTQRRWCMLDEPEVYNPARYPSVPHVNSQPIPPQDNNSSTASSDYDMAKQDFDEWMKADDDFIKRHPSYAQHGNFYILRDDDGSAHGLYEHSFQATATPRHEVDDTATQEVASRMAAPVAKPRPTSLDLIHRRLGHRATKSILLAQESNLYSDTQIVPDHDPFCGVCKISTIRATNRGPLKENENIKPGEALYIDVQPNICRKSLTKKTLYNNYINIVDAESRKFRCVGVEETKTEDVINALNQWAVLNKPYPGYTLLDDCEEIHVDAGSQLISQELDDWCVDQRIKLIKAAPNHQEMNGICERMWQAARKIANSLCTNARLGWPYFHHSLMYATRIMDVLPIKGCSYKNDEGDTIQSCPDAIFYDSKQVKINKYRVFGCPVIAKVYRKKTPKQEGVARVTLHSRNIIQRGVRGIFVGFPENQAGWLVYIPNRNKVFVSADVAFDEDFESFGLSHSKILYQDSLPVRSQGISYTDESRQMAFTGPPHAVEYASYTEDFPEDDEIPRIYEDDVDFLDTFEMIPTTAWARVPLEKHSKDPLEVEEDSDEDNDEEYGFKSILAHEGPLKPSHRKYKGSKYNVKILWNDDSSTWEPLKNVPDTHISEYARSKGILEHPDWNVYSSPPAEDDTMDEDTSDLQPSVEEGEVFLASSAKKRKRSFSFFASTIVDTITKPLFGTTNSTKSAMMASIDETEIDSPGSDPTPFLNTPHTVVNTLKMPLAVGRAWVKSFVKEVKGILIDRKSCKIEDPLPEDHVIPVMDVYRCKLDKDGLLDKLKTRIVFRGDLYNPQDPQDPWNPHASFLSLRVFLADCAARGSFPCQIDLILAYLQAKMKERVFVIFPESWKQFLPEHLHKWIGRPLLLLNALYGYTYSGKFLYQDLAEFLEKQGLKQIMPGYWIKHLENGKVIAFLHYVDDILADSNDPKAFSDFLAQLKERFDVEVRPRADWYLQTRIQQDKDLNISLDQTRYAKSVIQRFLPNVASEPPTKRDMRKYRSPLPLDAAFTKEDKSVDRDAVKQLETEFGFRYIELVGCFNWLSYTCFEELYAIRKLCRYLNLPGRAHFLLAIHLLHHFRCHPPKPLIFYHNVSESPIAKLLKDVPEFTKHWDKPDLIVFADSSHGDCDEGRSTACDLLVYQGGLIDFASWVPTPVPLSTAESENNCYSTAIMKALYVARCLAHAKTGNEDAQPATIPVCVDNSAAKIMNESENVSKRVRHVESRYWFGRRACQQGLVKFVKVEGKSQQPADIGTKNVQEKDARFYIDLFEAPYYT